MALTKHVILLGLISLSQADDCLLDRTTPEIRWEKELLKDVKSCDYDVFSPPKHANSGLLPVTLNFIMKYFSFDSNEEVFTVKTWMFVRWRDERLQWDPKKFGGIDTTEISSAQIWTPSFVLFNSVDSFDYDRYFYTQCHLESTGDVFCVPRLVHEAPCSVKLTNYPYDVQDCTLEYGPWSTKGVEFNLNVSSKAITMFGAAYGSQWFISDYKQDFKPGQLKQLNMTFTLEREAESLAAVIVYPSLILTVLTLLCSFLDVKNNIRLALVSFSIFSHFYWLTELSEYLPKESNYPPTILLYYRGSMVITTFLFLVTLILAVFCRKVTAPNIIVNSINGCVYGSFVRFLVFPQWSTDSIVVTDESNNNEMWTKFANSVNVLCTISVIIAYMGMYFAFVPQPIPIKY